MKRAITVFAAMAAAAAMTFALAGIALADAGPHGGYGPGAKSNAGWSQTDKCAACHRAHIGTDTDLLVISPEDALCKSCHQAGQGAGTDVWAGKFVANSAGWGGNSTVGGALNGGGFVDVFSYNLNAFASASSMHNVGGTAIAWGGGASGAGNQGPGFLGDLECSSCHNPHGSNNYRILQGRLDRYGAAAPWVTSAPGQADGVVGSPEIPATATKNYTLGLDTNYDRGMGDFCATCHTNYLISRSWGKGGTFAATTAANGASGGGAQQYDWDGDTVAEDTWRHASASKLIYRWDSGTSKWVTAPGHDRTTSSLVTSYTYHLRGAASDAAVAAGAPGVGLMPASSGAGSGRITCLTCHNAHGSSSVATGYAANAGVPGNAGSGALLFLDGRGVCQNCHNKKN